MTKDWLDKSRKVYEENKIKYKIAAPFMALTGIFKPLVTDDDGKKKYMSLRDMKDDDKYTLGGFWSKLLDFDGDPYYGSRMAGKDLNEYEQLYRKLSFENSKSENKKDSRRVNELESRLDEIETRFDTYMRDNGANYYKDQIKNTWKGVKDKTGYSKIEEFSKNWKSPGWWWSKIRPESP